MDEHKKWPGKLSHPHSYQQLREIARDLRSNQIPAERHLWKHLSQRQRLGFKFRRQHVIDRFIVDFYCAESALVIELDGGIHCLTEERDAARQEYLESLGLTVLRFYQRGCVQAIGARSYADR
ncbi:MAG TPA: endonuclease domain-containing protein [Aggregatilineales bacterium]|nr:endonuclease domain-containing protein [Aggregatilineales bacterium]HPV08490.1 endonuclease domain-containing protein [Aggregatilineales bacterium]HQA66727.1 endonuclease domain-containing protein [Aggregatilineales bacterium]HQE18069.1 endonuclease domain-containing protein [Aggregatilineales bacterium]